MKKDVMYKFKLAEQTFQNAPSEDMDFLQKFSFICLLSFDVYVKKLMIEKMLDEISEEQKKKKMQEKTEKKK